VSEVATNKMPNRVVVSPKAILKLPGIGQVKVMCKPVTNAIAPTTPKPGIQRL
jgi:hypothetical protein